MNNFIIIFFQTKNYNKDNHKIYSIISTYNQDLDEYNLILRQIYQQKFMNKWSMSHGMLYKEKKHKPEVSILTFKRY